MSYEPADAAGLNLQGHEARPGSGRAPSASRLAHPSRSGAESDPQGAFRRSPAFGAGAVAYRLAAAMRRVRDSNSRGAHHALHAFRACSSYLPDTLHCAEGERIERPRGSRPDLRLATGCLTTRPAFQRAPGGIRTLTPLRTRTPEARASSSSATGAWSGRRDLNSPYDHGEVACCR